jgi:hypothetical protein
MNEQPIEGEIVEPEQDPEQPIEVEDPFRGFLFPTRPFGELLLAIRQRIAKAEGRAITQAEFGAMLGHVNQITISRWQVGKQAPQKEHLKQIVELAHQYGMRGLTLARLEQSLHLDIEQFAGIDPRVVRLNTLLLPEDEAFKEEFFEVVIAVYHLLKGVRRSGPGER